MRTPACRVLVEAPAASTGMAQVPVSSRAHVPIRAGPRVREMRLAQGGGAEWHRSRAPGRAGGGRRPCHRARDDEAGRQMAHRGRERARALRNPRGQSGTTVTPGGTSPRTARRRRRPRSRTGVVGRPARPGGARLTPDAANDNRGSPSGISPATGRIATAASRLTICPGATGVDWERRSRASRRSRGPRSSRGRLRSSANWHRPPSPVPRRGPQLMWLGSLASTSAASRTAGGAAAEPLRRRPRIRSAST